MRNCNDISRQKKLRTTYTTKGKKKPSKVPKLNKQEKKRGRMSCHFLLVWFSCVINTNRLVISIDIQSYRLSNNTNPHSLVYKKIIEKKKKTKSKRFQELKHLSHHLFLSFIKYDLLRVSYSPFKTNHSFFWIKFQCCNFSYKHGTFKF